MTRLIGLFIMSLISFEATASFTQNPLTDKQLEVMRAKNVLSATCPIKTERLRLLTVSHYDFDQKSHDDGKIVVLDAVAPMVLNIFREMYERKFPLTKIRTLEHYQGSDDASMADNNTSCFNDRPISGSQAPSLHAYGLAIDINPIQNPCLEIDEVKGTALFKPSQGAKFANRLEKRPGKDPRPGMVEQIIEIFAKNGFRIWGGNWDTPIDYQHFQTSRSLAELLAAMSSQDACKFFEDFVRKPALFDELEKKFPETKLSAAYQDNHENFKKIWSDMSQ